MIWFIAACIPVAFALIAFATLAPEAFIWCLILLGTCFGIILMGMYGAYEMGWMGQCATGFWSCS